MTGRLTTHVLDTARGVPAAGVHVEAHLIRGSERMPAGSATEFAQVALLHGVTVVAGPALTSDGSCDDYVRLQFVQDSRSITLGVRRLAQAWQSYAVQRPNKR